MIRKILAVVVVLVVAVLAYATTKPDAFMVERSTTIKAPPEKVFAVIDDFHNWSSWSPWEKLDAAMTRTHSGAAAGKGAVYEWTGNSKVGTGRMEITESSPTSRVGIKLDFLKPFEAHNVAEFTLAPAGDSTKVTWTMRGPSPYMAKVMGVFASMDRMVGGDFETGLANLKRIAEQ